MDDTEEKLNIVDKALARNLRWITTADAKIPPVFAIDTAMLGVLAALLPLTCQWTIVVVIVSFIAAVFLIVSIVFLAVASFPRLKGPKGSIVYFGGAITIDETDYIKRLSSGVTTELIEDVARQAYRNAEIATAKYKAVRLAMIFMFVGMPFWLIAIVFLYSIRVVSATP